MSAQPAPPLAPDVDVTGPRSSGTVAWWGTVLALLAAASLHVTFAFSRVYLVGLGERELDLGLPLLATVLLLASSAPAGWAHRWVRLNRSGRTTALAVVLTLVLAVAHVVVLLLAYAGQDLDVQVSVEDASTLVLVGFHLVLLAVVAGSVAVAAAVLAGGEPSARRRSAAQAGTLAWHAMVGMWVASFVVIYLLPRLS